ncbi:class F sortase [Streptomyces sp. CC219B]|uniref:class F sortase n=1 Tax=Streptomyces sp. CC219B TaxID=3044574 RepID=UPI0024A87F73|nr:class F sortase [Streptomyces sp. CC219B]
MGTARAQRRTFLGAVMALFGIVLAAAALLLAGARADRAAGTGDFGTAPTATAAPKTQQTASPAPSRTAAGPAAPAASTVPAPRELVIPRLGLRAPIDPVGVADDGQMEVPKDPDRVGWYRYSPAPGADRGSSVVVGHVDAKGLGLGVLFGLTEVRQGDRVRVARDDGTTLTYEITARRTLGKAALVSSAVFDRDGPAVLNLVTCAGPYLPDRGGYQNNLVVTAVEVPR